MAQRDKRNSAVYRSGKENKSFTKDLAGHFAVEGKVRPEITHEDKGK